MKIPSMDICKILESCKVTDVKYLKYGDLEIKFGPESLTETYTMPQNDTNIVPFEEIVVEPTDDLTSKLVMDPLLYEEMVDEE